MKRIYKLRAILGLTLFFCFTVIIYADTTAENFALYNIKGERFILYNILNSLPDGSMLIVNFTSVKCLPCTKEIPELKNISESTAGNTKLMCIYAETTDVARISAESLGVSECSYVDPFGNIQKTYNIKKYPVTFIIDKKFKILGRFEGYSERNIKKIKQLCKMK
jgi:thiol-disulfide isomerase/thioredoxin